MQALMVLASLALALVSGMATAADGSADDWADIVHIELSHGQPMPLLSVYYDQLNRDSAYDIQRALVTRELRRKRVIGGFKAGFTNAALRAKFRAKEPISGVLFADAAFPDGATVDAGLFKRPMLEVELGFVLRSPVTRRLRSVADLSTYISHVVPVVEIPDLNYANVGGLNANDIIATNVSASHHVVGKPFVLANLGAVNDITMAFYRDDRQIDSGRARDAMGDQLEALLWLVNDVQARGWPLLAGQVFITGTLGKMHPAVSGAYRVDYGLGRSLAFTFKPAAPAQAQPK